MTWYLIDQGSSIAIWDTLDKIVVGKERLRSDDPFAIDLQIIDLIGRQLKRIGNPIMIRFPQSRYPTKESLKSLASHLPNASYRVESYPRLPKKAQRSFESL